MFLQAQTTSRAGPLRVRPRGPKQFKGRTRPNLPLSSKFKTEMCHYLSEQGRCPFGEHCTYAHAEVELRFIERHPKHKTLPCRDFSTVGFCPFGERCSFIHHKSDPKEILRTPGLVVEAGLAASPILFTPEHQSSIFSNSSLHPSSLHQTKDTTMDHLRPPTVSSGYPASVESSRSPSSLSSMSLSRSSSYSDVSDLGAVAHTGEIRLPVFRDLSARKPLVPFTHWL